MHPNDFGQAVETSWHDLPPPYPHLTLDAFVLMPNHVHGVLVLGPAWPESRTRHGLPEILRAFKTFSARRLNALRNLSGEPVWQRGYYEHVIRSPDSLARVREYIAANPARWALDREHPANVRYHGVGAGFKPAPTG